MIYTYIVIFLALVTQIQANNNQDLYKKIKLEPQASVDECKKQCKILMNKHKPENYPGDYENHKYYVDIKDICQTLTLPDKKNLYDQYGDEGLKQLQSGSIVQNRWGQMQQRQAGPNMQADIPVTLQDLYMGASKSFSVQKNVLCDHCNGTGDKDGKLKVCRHCKGKGHVMQNVQMGIGFNMQMQQTCDRCGGKGRTGSSNCPICRGKKVQKKTIEMEVNVKPGMKDEQQIVFQGEAEQTPDQTPGDLVFTLKQKQHGYFKRIEETLYYTAELSLKDAILGYKKNIKHLDDHYTVVQSAQPNVVQPFSVQTLKGEGFPKERNPRDKGDLQVLQKVTLPKKLTAEDRQILTKLFSLGK